MLPGLDRTYVGGGDHHVVEPDGLLILPVLPRWIAVVVAVVLEPEAIDFHVVSGAPAQAGELTDEAAVDPHRLLAIRFVRRGVGLDHELPALPAVQRRDDPLRAGRLSLSGA